VVPPHCATGCDGSYSGSACLTKSALWIGRDVSLSDSFLGPSAPSCGRSDRELVGTGLRTLALVPGWRFTPIDHRPHSFGSHNHIHKGIALVVWDVAYFRQPPLSAFSPGCLGECSSLRDISSIISGRSLDVSGILTLTTSASSTYATPLACELSFRKHVLSEVR
jgi:hypothetical protein